MMLNQEVDDTKEPKIFRKKPVEICAMKWTGKNVNGYSAKDRISSNFMQ